MTTKHVIQLGGQRFGRLVVQRFAGVHPKSGLAMWECLCDCGTLRTTQGRALRSGVTQSCGCLRIERASAATVLANRTHGKTKSRVYRIWTNMVSRCTNPKFDAYPWYGGRGIKVCERWRTFANFLEDMGDPAPELTIDRIDPEGDYCPENCRWSTWRQQAHNKASVRLLPYEGQMLPMSEVARRLGMSIGTLWSRLDRGWSPERAVQTPLRPQAVREAVETVPA